MSRTQSAMVALGTLAPAFELVDVVSGKAVGRDDVFAMSWDDERSDAQNKMPGGGTSQTGRHGLLVMFICVHCPYVKHVEEELARIGRAFAGVPQLANMVEGGGRTPVLPPDELYRLGFAMVAYPTTLIFRVARAIEGALADLKAAGPAGKNDAVDFETFKDIVSLARWAEVERRSAASGK